LNEPLQPVPQKWAFRFFTIWTGQAFSLFGSALVQFALIWYLAEKEGSGTVLALATLAGMLPQVLVGPFAGALADRWNRRLIMICADAAIATGTLILAYLFASGRIQIWHIYSIMAFRSLGTAFHMPAMSASTRFLVPEQHLTRVGGLNQTLQGLQMLAAPPLGALLISVLPTQSVLFIDISTAALAILPLLFFSIPQPEQAAYETQEEKPSLLKDVRAGWLYVSRWPGLMAILFMALILNFLLTPVEALTPLLVTKYFQKGALEFGLMNSSVGFGIIAGGVLLGVWGGFKRKVATSMLGIIGIGVGVTMEGLAPVNLFWLAVLGAIITGFMSSMANGPLGAVLQSVVRADMQGRVMGLVNSAASAMSPLGLLIAGPVSDAIGIRTWFWIAGVVTLLMGILGFFIPAVMNLENNREDQSSDQKEKVTLPPVSG
jgi:MFS transporter, DHA3 family, macrolide efflux protein